MKNSGRKSKNIEDRRFSDFNPDSLVSSAKRMKSKVPIAEQFSGRTESQNKFVNDQRSSTKTDESISARRRVVDPDSGKEYYRNKSKTNKLDTQVTPGKWKSLNTVSYGG